MFKFSTAVLLTLCVVGNIYAAPPLPYSPDFPAWQQSVEKRLDELVARSAVKVSGGTCANCPCSAPDCPKNAAVGAAVRYVQVCQNGTCKMVPASVGGFPGLPDELTGADFGPVYSVAAGSFTDVAAPTPKRVRWHLFGKPHRR